ncbi:MAG TPA: ABC transporter permease [Puia sp.]|nr:ABC transporter permease [Puia sp.]
MFKNYLKTAIRQLSRNRLFSALNILGLATGLCGSIFIFLWVQDERSFDRQNPHAEDVFRVTSMLGDTHAATTPLVMAPFLQRTLPQVKQAVRFCVENPETISYGNKRFVEKRIWYADSNFQELFNFPLVNGDPRHILDSKDQVLMTESTAKRYFGDKDPVGQRLHIESQRDMVVAGVLKDLPRNSSIQFDILMPMSIMDESQANGPWNNFVYYSYLRLDHTTASDPAAIDRLEKTLAEVFKKNANQAYSPSFTLQRLTDIHLGEHYFMDAPGGGSMQYVRIFSLVAVFILLIACINFMNLSTALSSRRAKEVGLRKTIGAMRWQLVAQFLGEAVMLALLSLGLAVILVWLLMPLFDGLTGKDFSMGAFSGGRILLLLGIGVLAGLISGSYPALVLSRFQPVKVLKGTTEVPRWLRTRWSVAKQLHRSSLFQPGKAYFRNGLVVLQFTIAIALMVGTLVVFRQLQFIRNRDMGYDKGNLLYVTMPQVGFNEMQKGARQIDAAVADEPGIVAHAVVSDLPTNLISGDPDVQWAGKDPKDQTVFPLLGADENTLNVFGMHLLEGRTFSRAYGNNDSGIVVNQAALREMHMDPATAVGKPIRYSGRNYSIIGVVRDFNFRPVQYNVEPLLILYRWSHAYDYVVVKTAPGATEKVIAELKNRFSQVYPQEVFDYGFVDKDLDALYASEQRMGELFNVFSLLAIFISCLGLFGLSAYTTQRRIKEIGVRKVLGASVQGIVGLLAREFLIPVAVATLIAFPLAAWGMDKWLHVFAYRIGLEWWFFAVAGGLALLVALCTVSYESLRAARSNPVRALRSD